MCVWFQFFCDFFNFFLHGCNHEYHGYSPIICFIFVTIKSTAMSCFLSFGIMTSAYRLVGLICLLNMGLNVDSYCVIILSKERPRSRMSLNIRLINLVSSSSSTNKFMLDNSLIFSFSKIRMPSTIMMGLGTTCSTFRLLVWLTKSYVGLSTPRQDKSSFKCLYKSSLSSELGWS